MKTQEIEQKVFSKITEEEIKNYQRDGAICVRQLLSPSEIDLLRHGIDLNLAHLSSRSKIASRTSDPGFFVQDFCNWQFNDYYRHFIYESPLGMVAAFLMQSPFARLYHDHMLVKESGTKQRTPWHQDQPYYNIEGSQTCSFWIPVDAVSREATLEFIAGSHLGPWLMPRSFLDNQAKWFPEGTLAELPDIESARENYPIIGWKLSPGDVVCFHMLTLHAAAGVEKGRRRRVFSLRFFGEDIKYMPRSWVTSPHFPGLEKELVINGSMEHPLFPIIWKYDRKSEFGIPE